MHIKHLIGKLYVDDDVTLGQVRPTAEEEPVANDEVTFIKAKLTDPLGN
jgi:hypothetical protein